MLFKNKIIFLTICEEIGYLIHGARLPYPGRDKMRSRLFQGCLNLLPVDPVSKR